MPDAPRMQSTFCTSPSSGRRVFRQRKHDKRPFKPPLLRPIGSWNSKRVGSEVPNRRTAGRLGCVAFATGVQIECSHERKVQQAAPQNSSLEAFESRNSKIVPSGVPNRKTAGRLGCVAFAKPVGPENELQIFRQRNSKRPLETPLWRLSSPVMAR